MLTGIVASASQLPSVPEDTIDSPLTEQLRRKNAELEAELASARLLAQKYQDLLIAAAHEMRTPLHALGLHLEMLGRSSSRANDQALIDQLEVAKRVLSGYVRRTSLLLDAARVTAGVFALKREPVALKTLVMEILELYAPKAHFHHASIKSHVDPGLVGEWDRAAVETILANLISNALKYGASTPVSVEAMADGAGNAVIRVIDSGPGIAEHQRQHIFEKFGRGVNSNSTIAGYGLGLWIAQQLSMLHGGSIVLDASRGGSTFIVTLPLRQDAAATNGNLV